MASNSRRRGKMQRTLRKKKEKLRMKHFMCPRHRSKKGWEEKKEV